jgi:FecR protein
MLKGRIARAVATCAGAIPALMLLVASPVTATAASADAPQIGEAELVVSLVRGRLGQTTRELAIKDNVYSEEIIETDADAAARIVFLDGTELSMGPSSRMVLDRYVYDPGAGTGEMAMRMVTGVFEFASGNIPSSGYDLGTPFGNLAIRGTRCVVDVAAGSRLVLRCSELDPEGVSIAGETVSTDSDCLLVPLPGTGSPVFLSNDDCEQQLQQVAAMFAMLGLV